MKKLSFLVLTIGLVFCCKFNSLSAQVVSGTTTKGHLSQEEKEERNKEVALASVEAINKHDIDAALKDASPDIINYGNGSIPPVKGIEQVKSGLRMFTLALPIDKSENVVAVADGDYVLIWGKWSGSWKQDIMGQKATGKPYTKTEVEIFRFNNEGKIIEHHSVQSFSEVARQIGLNLPKRD